MRSSRSCRPLVVVLLCLLSLGGAIAVRAAFAETSDDEAANASPTQSDIPSVTIDQGYTVPTMAPPPGADVPKKMKKYAVHQGGPYYHVSRPAKMTRKLWRGAHNVLFGWIEIPKTVMVDTAAVDPFTGLVTGVVIGAAKAVERTGVGAVEIVTFWHEWPKDFRPIIEPEFVMDDFRD